MINMALHAVGWRQVRELPSGKYQARWADSTGRERAKSFWDKRAAEKYAGDQATNAQRVMVGLTAASCPVEEALQAFLERRLDPKTTALNERRMREFLATMPEVRFTAQITDSVINRFDAILEAKGCNPGGRHHVLKIVRAFCRMCVKKGWLTKYPFADFRMPQSTFEGRPLTDAEYALMCSGDSEPDVWLHRALTLGREAMLRVSQVWELTPECFRAPDQLWVRGIKGQPDEWKSLTGGAAALVSELVKTCPPGRRLFSFWSSVGWMEMSVYRKGLRVGLRAIGDKWPRFHDACKVSQVSMLAKDFSLAELAHISNTSKKTLVAHYIKADREKSYDKYKRYSEKRDSLEGETCPSPIRDEAEIRANAALNQPQTPNDSTESNGVIDATSQPVSNL